MKILIQGGLIFDGINPEGKNADVLIEDNLIVKVAKNIKVFNDVKVINATGLYVSPGFIDSHASDGYAYLRKDAGVHKIYQGITTELFGNCGFSQVPLFEGNHSDLVEMQDKIGFTCSWNTLTSYFDIIINLKQLPINIATLVGHSTLKKGLSKDIYNTTKDELNKMSKALSDSMKEGAFGLSTGLIYSPGMYADTAEIVELLKSVKPFKGIYSTHIRNERENIEEALDEAFNIAATADVPLLISHLKVAEEKNWGKMRKILDKIESFKNKHTQRVAFDIYPYTSISTKLKAFISKELFLDGDKKLHDRILDSDTQKSISMHFKNRQTNFEKMYILSKENQLDSIYKLAMNNNREPFEEVCNILHENLETWIIYDCISSEDMDKAILNENSMICSDSWSYPTNAKTYIGDPHPRTYGAFSRFLDLYHFKTQKLSYGEAIKKLTSVPAKFIGLEKRGVIKEGYFADIILMNPQTFCDNATYVNPRSYSSGIEYMLINGKITIERSKLVNKNNGKTLYKQQ